ncbi:hypothetical protein C5167_010552 [Papaver somniferum]|uniref:S-acyltransferase n=1 Tax=Papaver somniferum TaxID=3469 RepID=A0A4Y7K4E8_PAPSO|nr:hypothetical protein C5167_010552 [Papaver somniferum]
MTNIGFCSQIRGLRDTICGCCSKIIPCLSDPETRSSWGLKASLVMLHLLYVGVLFIFDKDLIQKTVNQPWYTAAYLFVLLATLAQYFITAGTSPGYVLDAMRVVNESHAAFRKTSDSKGPGRKNLFRIIQHTMDKDGYGHVPPGIISKVQKLRLVFCFIMFRTWTCSHCNIVQNMSLGTHDSLFSLPEVFLQRYFHSARVSVEMSGNFVVRGVNITWNQFHHLKTLKKEQDPTPALMYYAVVAADCRVKLYLSERILLL